jgi:hypothetical protein
MLQTPLSDAEVARGQGHGKKLFHKTLKPYLGPDGIILILLVLLAVAGIGITGISPLFSHR